MYPHCCSRIYDGSVGTLGTLAGRTETRPGKTFEVLRPELSINFEEIIWPIHGNFEEKNKVLDPSIIISNNLIFITNAHYNYIV